jgi:hypothetical protein
MPPLPPHHTQRGLDLGLRWNGVPVPPTAEYWLYEIIATRPDGADRPFKMLIRRAAYPVEADADGFLLTDPLADVKGQLEHADADGMPLFWPNFGGDWAAF